MQVSVIRKTDSEQQFEDRPIGGGGATTSRETVEKGQVSEDTNHKTEQVEQEQVSDEDTNHETEEAGLNSNLNGSGEGSQEETPKSQKRVQRPEKWKKTKRAKRRNSGEAFWQPGSVPTHI